MGVKVTDRGFERKKLGKCGVLDNVGFLCGRLTPEGSFRSKILIRAILNTLLL